MNSHRKGKLTAHGSKGNIPKVDFRKPILVKIIGGMLYKDGIENFNNNSQKMHSQESSEASEIGSSKGAKKVNNQINL